MASLVVAGPADAAGIYLHRGSRGAKVMTRVPLHTLGLLSRAAVDRRYRQSTWKAVKSFQRSHGSGYRQREHQDLNQVAAAYRRAITTPPKVTAHRGGSDERPENTLAAFRHAVAIGADAVEFDVRSTADHRLVVLHDRTLDRTTNCTGTVYKRTFAQVRACRTNGNGQPVPTLKEVLDYLASTSIRSSRRSRTTVSTCTTARSARSWLRCRTAS